MNKTTLVFCTLIGVRSFAGGEPISWQTSARVSGPPALPSFVVEETETSPAFILEREVLWMSGFWENAFFETTVLAGERFARDEFRWFPFGRGLFVGINFTYSTAESISPVEESVSIFAGIQFALGR